MDRQVQAQWLASGVVEAPVEKVWEALLSVSPFLSPTDRRKIANYNDVRPFTIAVGEPGEGRLNLEVDKQHYSFAVQGEWWYRGVHSVEPHTRGSLLVYRVYNVAPGASWWIAQLVQGRNHARDVKKQFRKTLRAVGERLECDAKLGERN